MRKWHFEEELILKHPSDVANSNFEGLAFLLEESGGICQFFFFERPTEKVTNSALGNSRLLPALDRKVFISA